MNEIWKDIEGYEGLYQVSNMGNIKSLCRYDANNHLLKERLLKPDKTKFGYYQITLSKNGITKRYTIHKLVCLAFLPNPDNKPCIDHINTDRTDNRVENLRWCTYKENMNNPITTKKIGKANTRTHKKAILQLTVNGDVIYKWDSATDVEKKLGISKVSICACLKHKPHCNTAGGYRWQYLDEWLADWLYNYQMESEMVG